MTQFQPSDTFTTLFARFPAKNAFYHIEEAADFDILAGQYSPASSATLSS
jgi:hypothetical protein